VYVVPRRKINDGPSIAEPPFKRFDVTVYPILPPRPNHGCSAVFVAVPIVKVVVADASDGFPNLHRRCTPGRKLLSVDLVLVVCDGFVISTTAPPNACPVAFFTVQLPAGALDLYSNNAYVPASSVFNGVVLYPIPLFVTVTCTLAANFLGGVTTRMVP
jgi:hypothetical protein